MVLGGHGFESFVAPSVGLGGHVAAYFFWGGCGLNYPCTWVVCVGAFLFYYLLWVGKSIPAWFENGFCLQHNIIIMDISELYH
jgi:hypothetical protein